MSRAEVLADRVCWLIWVGFAVWVVQWAWLAPKVGS
jgi:hypothetical protein